MYRNLVVQGNLISSHRWSHRFIFFSWCLYSFYIQALYSGTLTAVLAITSFEKPIDSLHELAQARRDGYTLGCVRDSSFVDAFKNAEGGIYKEVWKLFNHKDPDQSFMPTPDAGMDMVLKKKFIFINSRMNSKLKAAQRGRNKFHIGRQTFLPQGSGIAFSNGSPYKIVFSRILIRLSEIGLLYKWVDDELNKVSQFLSTSSDAGPKPISLQHLQAAFFIMVLGFATSAVVLVLEIIVRRLWQNTIVADTENVVI
ncbi:glutamate receptor ionotropic, delta-2-like [Panulirus ornatus]|uniref:glutamate receptor ionotropic, delta-2-like n=1 Tax=Panulirus ornatus TaxID=150431 RepID=UPI003A8AFA51